MSFNEKLPEWNNAGIEPPQSKKAEGFNPGEKPPAQWFNWLLNRIYKAIQELREKVVVKIEGKGLSTNDYTNEDKDKLVGIAAKAQVNNILDINAIDLTDGGDTSLHYHLSDRNRANHTGTQTASTISDFAATVRSIALDGLSTATNAVISSTDNILGALGKLQKQITDFKALKGATNGLAELDSTGHVPSHQLPSYVDDVLEYPSRSNFPTTGESGKIYVAIDTNLTYRWSGSAYVEISPSLALGETSSTAYRGDRGKIAYDHSQTSHAPSNAQKNSDITKTEIEAKLTGNITSHKHTVTKLDVDLNNVDNVKQMPIGGGTFSGIATAHSNTSYTVRQMRNIILSPNDADINAMQDGDIWIKYK